MSAQPITLACPKCGGTNESTSDQIQVQCAYCGSAITVPEELRQQATPSEPEKIVIVQQAISSEPEKIVIVQQAPRYIYTAPKANWFATLFTLIFIGALVSLVTLQVPGNPLAGIVGGALAGKNLPVLGDQPELTFGGEGTGVGLFQGGGAAITVDRAGNVYALDRNTLRLQKFDTTGKFVTSWNIGEETGSKAQGAKALTSDPDGNVYAIWQGDILKYDGNGKLLNRFKIGASSNATVRTFNNLTILPDRNLLAVGGSFDDALIWVNAATGAEIKRAEKPINSLSDERIAPFWIYPAVDGLGNIFILAGDPSGPFVYKFTAQGKFVTKFGGKGNQPSNFRFPTGIAVDNQSRVYVADDTIKVFDANGTFLKKIGAGNSASGVAVDNQNRIYMMTRENKILRYASQ